MKNCIKNLNYLYAYNLNEVEWLLKIVVGGNRSVVVVNDDFLFWCICVVRIGLPIILLNVFGWNVAPPSTKEEDR